jgi:hypothetical protein
VNIAVDGPVDPRPPIGLDPMVNPARFPVVILLLLRFCVVSMVQISAENAVRETTAPPSKEIAAFELLDLMGVRDMVVPDTVYTPFPISQFAPSSMR